MLPAARGDEEVEGGWRERVREPETSSVRQDRLGRYLSGLLGQPLTVRHMERIEGGWSRQTHRVVTTTASGDDVVVALRGEVENSLLDTDLEREWHILEAVDGSGLPLPDVHGFEPSGAVLGHRFITMGWIDGTGVNPWRMRPGEQAAWEAVRDDLGRQWIDDIVLLHRIDPARLRRSGIDADVDAPSFVATQVAHWTSILRHAEHPPGPLVEEACRWLEDHVPAPASLTSIVHGDLRIGNMLVDAGRVVAFLDWEMAGIGDWRADLGYSLMPYNAGKFLKPVPPSWNHLMAPRPFLERYFASAGMEASDDEIAFFIVLGNIKMIAILCTGIDAFMQGRTTDPRLAWLSLAVPGLVADIYDTIDRGLPW